MKKERYTHTAFPTFFKACCFEASSGGRSSYSDAGYHLAIHLYDLGPYELGDQEWHERIKDLCHLLQVDGSSIGIWAWFSIYLPKCMEIVPRRRMKTFVRGVRQAYENGRID